MNILQTFLQLENNDILNKIYNYLGKHPIIEKTRLTNAITTYRMKLNKSILLYSISDIGKKNHIYFNNLRNVRKIKKND